jgi:MoxR-like ATPase
MDRFTVRLSLGYPAPKDEIAMVLNRQEGNPLHKLSALMTRDNLVAMQEEVENTYIKDSVVKYIVDLIVATRNNEDILRGASPRATLAVTAMAKSIAQLQGRDYVTPTDVQAVFVQTVAHRLLLTPAAEAGEMTAEKVLRAIISEVKAPRVN